MKEFAVGAVVIAGAVTVFTVLLMALAPLSSLNPSQSRAPAHVKNGIHTHIAVLFVIGIVVGVASHGVGAGVLEYMKKRKK